MAYEGRKALVKVGGTPVATTAEPANTSDDQIYQITDANKQIISPDSVPIVYDDAVQTTESYTIERVEGIVTFENVDAGRGTVTLDYDYVPTNQAAEAHEYSFTASSNLQDITPFFSDWAVKQCGIKSGEGSLSDWDVIDTYFEDALLSGDPIIIELYPSATSEPIRSIGFLNSSEISAAINSAQDKSVSFETSEAFKIN